MVNNDSIVNLPKRLTSGKPHQIKPKVNPIRALQDREYHRKQILAAKAAAAAASSSASSSKPKCPNKNCPNPNVVDGTCQTCGRVADDSNIVAEVSFGENAQGGAIVQGQFIGADQGSVRPMAGIGHRRVAGNGSAEARERAMREARNLMNGYAAQLHVSEHIVSIGFQFYRLASNTNFVQGRKIQNVVAVCLYASCRRQDRCNVMLIDLADIVKEEVFRLGRTFKKLLEAVGAIGHGIAPFFAEDLVVRFASKLEFTDLTHKVAEAALRLMQRMDRDWMMMGRRPAGICGACLILAARMFNFRRTVREVVYVAKVTMATLQMRLDEFKELPSAQMTVEDFLTKDFISEEYDPPAIYKKRAEYQAKLKEQRAANKKKRQLEEADEAPAEEGPNRRHRKKQKRTQAADDSPTTPTQTDADGFVVPSLPKDLPQAKNLGEQGVAGRAVDLGTDIDSLAAEFGDRANDAEENGNATADTPNVNAPTAAPSTPASASSEQPRRKPKGSSCRPPPGYLDDAWVEDEEIMEMEIEETINDPKTAEHQKAFAEAEKRVAKIMDKLRRQGEAMAAANPRNNPAVSDNPDVHEDEFANDPEVLYCLLSEEDVKIKTQIWLNANKAYLREKQEKEFKAKLAADGPKKQTRRRTRQPRIGEGQTSPASTAGEAAVQVMENRKFSKKINYDAMRRMLDGPRRTGPGSVISEFTGVSQQTSRAASSVGEGDNYQSPAKAQAEAQARAQAQTSGGGNDKPQGDEAAVEEEFDEEDPGEDFDAFGNENDGGDGGEEEGGDYDEGAGDDDC